MRLMLIGGPPSMSQPEASALRAKGFEVVTTASMNDATYPISNTEDRIAAFRLLVFREALSCDGLAMVQGWMDDVTAKAVREAFRHIGMPVFSVGTWLEARLNGDGSVTVVSTTFLPVLDKRRAGQWLPVEGKDFMWFGPVTEAMQMPPTRALPTQGGGA